MAWFVYIARCADGTLYCGMTNDVAARLAAHNAGKGARYTRSRRPIDVVLIHACRSRGAALRLEYRVKQLTRIEKQRLVTRGAIRNAVTRRLPRGRMQRTPR